MDKVKKYLKRIGVLVGFALIYFVIMSLLAYTGILKLSTVNILNLIVFSVVTLMIGIGIGKKTSKKGYLEGLKYGGIFVLIMLLLNLIFYREFSLYTFLYYVILLASPTIGSMIGINMKH